MNALAANETAWDYVVVGAGSAGCAVASRLSESGRFRVLLLEAGEDDPWLWLKVPLGAGFVLLSQRSLWRFYTEPQANLDGRRVFWPRGRVLGGSSSINGMLWVRGEPAEFDHWRQLGNPGWGYADVLPFLKRMEAYGKGDNTVRGNRGPIHISRFGRSTLAEAFHAACVAAGVPATPDYNGVAYMRVSATCRAIPNADGAGAGGKPTSIPRAAAATSSWQPVPAPHASRSTRVAPSASPTVAARANTLRASRAR
jgi:choline dehydrogenase